MPMLTLGLGPVGEFSCEGLMANLPAFDLFDLYFLPGFGHECSGMKQSTRSTYRIPHIKDIGNVFRNFSPATRQQIRKAEKLVTITESEDTELLYRMVSQTFRRQNKKTPYSLAYVERINEACRKHKCRKILVAKDAAGNVHGACFLAWDEQTAYYIMGGSDPKFKSSAAYSLLMWHAIQEASHHAHEFDFCGSSIASVARFFAGFGAEPVPYTHLKKVNSKALKLVLALKAK